MTNERALRGDELIPNSIGSVSFAITIRRPPREVWLWLAQMGAGSRGVVLAYELHYRFPGLPFCLIKMGHFVGIDSAVCQAVLDALVDAQFLCVTSGGQYARLTDSEAFRQRPAKADLRAQRSVRKGFVISAVCANRPSVGPS